MIEQKKQEKIQYHLMELRKLRATPRSDWHAGFEAALRIELHKYGNAVQLSTEEELGTMPPRVDYMILVENRKVAFEKEIFRIFRKFNIIEYKNPRDSLTEQVILKAAGYACLFIGVAEHVGDRPKEEVTISIFRASKNPELTIYLGIFFPLNGILRILPRQIFIRSAMKRELCQALLSSRL